MKYSKYALLAASMAFAATLVPHSASASASDTAFFTAHGIAGSFNTGFNPGTYTQTFGTTSATYTGAFSPAPSVTLHAVSTRPDPFVSAPENDLGGQVNYGYTITGPGFGLVPIVISTTMGVSGSVNSSSDGRDAITAQLHVSAGDVLVKSVCTSGSSGGCAAVSEPNTGSNFSGPISFLSGRQGSVELIVDAIVSNGVVDGTIDPTIAIDPTFANASAYTVTLSAGVANAGGPGFIGGPTGGPTGGTPGPTDGTPGPTSVPEPGSIMLLAGGLFGMVGSRRRQRSF